MEIKLAPGNIFSGSKTLAVFTNPTEIAFRKGNLKNHYPVVFNGRKYKDSEELYQKLSRIHKHDAESCYILCTYAIRTKLWQYPELIDTIAFNGGVKWLAKCSHHVNGKSPRWEGDGMKSGFIRCLILAYKNVSEIYNG